MSVSLVCKMPGCGGVLGDKTVSLQTSCYSSSSCRACNKCGRVHSYDGNLMFNRPGAAVYLREDGLDLVMEPITFEPGKVYHNTGYLYVCLENKGEDVPEMVDLEPDTLLVFDGMDDQMFRFHDESGVKYLLHRGDVNCVEPVVKWRVWTMAPNDRGQWQMRELVYDSEESAGPDKLLLQMTGYMVKVLQEGTKP